MIAKKEETQAKKEAGIILKNLEKQKCELPSKEKNILQWSTGELKTYILSETAKLGAKKKLKFARDLMKRIEKEKKRQKG